MSMVQSGRAHLVDNIKPTYLDVIRRSMYKTENRRVELPEKRSWIGFEKYGD
jgi:hypothetical protein